MKLFLKNERGSVMIEYIVITTVFMLGIGCVLFFGTEKFDSFTGLFPEKIKTSMTEKYTVDGEFSPASVVDSNIKEFGAAGGAFAGVSQNAQRVVAMPQI